MPEVKQRETAELRHSKDRTQYLLKGSPSCCNHGEEGTMLRKQGQRSRLLLLSGACLTALLTATAVYATTARNYTVARRTR